MPLSLLQSRSTCKENSIEDKTALHRFTASDMFIIVHPLNKRNKVMNTKRQNKEKLPDPSQLHCGCCSSSINGTLRHCFKHAKMLLRKTRTTATWSSKVVRRYGWQKSQHVECANAMELKPHPISESEMATLKVFLLRDRVCEFMAFLYHVEELPHWGTSVKYYH